MFHFNVTVSEGVMPLCVLQHYVCVPGATMSTCKIIIHFHFIHTFSSAVKIFQLILLVTVCFLCTFCLKHCSLMLSFTVCLISHYCIKCFSELRITLQHKTLCLNNTWTMIYKQLNISCNVDSCLLLSIAGSFEKIYLFHVYHCLLCEGCMIPGPFVDINIEQLFILFLISLLFPCFKC